MSGKDAAVSTTSPVYNFLNQVPPGTYPVTQIGFQNGHNIYKVSEGNYIGKLIFRPVEPKLQATVNTHVGIPQR